MKLRSPATVVLCPVSAAVFVASEIRTDADAEGQMIVEESPDSPELCSNAPTADGTGIAFVEI